MATYDVTNPITKFSESWEGKTGQQVEDFITRKLKQPLAGDITYEGNVLTIYNSENEPIAKGTVTPVEPSYVNEVRFSELKVDSTVHTDGLEVNYTEDLKFYAGVNIKTYYIQGNDKYNLPNKVDVVFAIEGDPTQYVVENVSPKAYNDDSVEYFEITPLLQSSLKGRTIRATVTTAKASAYATFKNVTIHKITLSTSATYVDNKTITFDIDGLTTTGNMKLEYYDVLLGSDPASYKSPDTLDLDSSDYVELSLEKIGSHQILARITNEEHTFYSNWVQANVIAFDSSNKQEMMVAISGIPSSIVNCENANLYKIICVPGTGGTAEIISYLADEAGHFSKEDWSNYEFNRTSISTTSNDSESTSNYYTYIELPEVSDAKKFVAFKLKIDNVEYPIYQLYISKGSLSSRKYFTINIQENPYNVNGAFNYTEGAKDNFSQITGQSTTFFTNINPSIEASDGWSVDSDLVCYKLSGQNKNLFTEEKDFSDLLNSDKGFSVEVMLKNYNVNGEDPVMNIGNLLFGPGFTQINHTDKSDEGIYVNSRADYEKDVITHLMFVFDPAYKPTTYVDTYNKFFTEGNESYSTLQHTYPILKVYVNGCINREIEVTRDDLKTENGFKLQICPKTSDVNFYIFRTYRKALNYAEIQKNFISSRSSAQDKKDIYDRNDILGSDGKISFYKSMLKHNVLVFVLPKDEKPLFFGNRLTTGDGLGPDGTGKSKATILVRYKDEKYKAASGRFTGGKYKAQGSSAKKYMIHNTQYSKGNFVSEEQIASGITEGTTKYVIPTDTEQIAAKKLVGKVNYASSMQSHKQGAIKLYDKAYKEIFPEGKLYNGGKKACLEEAFMYFYYNVDNDSQLDTITMEDLYTVSTVNNIVVANDARVKFLGFQTWGSAKADDPTYGYDEDKTPEYLLVEGADNASPGANFKQPWAAFQTWDSTKTRKEHANGTGKMVQQPESVTSNDYTTGLLIEGETIQFESDTDPWDIDYGLQLYQLEGESEDDAEKRDLWVFREEVKNTSLKRFVEFYNNCYQYDFTNLLKNPNADQSVFDLSKTYDATDKRIYMTETTKLYNGGVDTNKTAKFAHVYRWDILKNMWVPAGLHFSGTSWKDYDLANVYSNLKNTELYKKYHDTFTEDFDEDIAAPEDIIEFVIPAFKDMFKATVEEYCDVDDIAYHQAFIRLVSGTDNRAKNTYFQIIGKLYDDGVQTETGDYKIRLMQDDLDTIFATDNNGQQVKPYYLLEPPFNKDTEGMWGDAHSAFFYPFDVCYYEKINEYLGKLITHLIGGATSIKDINTNLHKYFFETQINFPEIAYNHHAEIYYEMPQVVYSNGDVLVKNGQKVFNSIIGDFKNNGVKNPLSLSHGRCLESEYQFMKDRLLLLGTSTLTATGLYSGDSIKLSDYSTGGDISAYTVLKGKASYTDYFYPIRSTSTDNKYYKIGNNADSENPHINYDRVFNTILEAPGVPKIISELVTPREEPFEIQSDVRVGMGAFLNAGSKYKTMEITQGLDYSTRLLHLPNAKSLKINGATTNYKVTDTTIKVKEFLPIIENLEITNTPFGNSVLDFRGCNRLEKLDLSGCTGIIDIIFPENDRLKSVNLPAGLKKLTLGKNPALSTFVFAEDTKLTELSLDCSSFHPSFNYVDLLENRIDYANLTQFIIKNTPSGGLKITEAIALKLASVKTSGVTAIIKGTYVISNRDTEASGLVWTSKTNISYLTKKCLVEAFRDIDSNTNEVCFLYEVTAIKKGTYVLPSDISIDAPQGGTFTPFDGLYFTEGNNIAINNGQLHITYTVSGLPTGYSIDPNTGVFISQGNTNKAYEYSIVVYTANGPLSAITGQLHLNYIEPAIGDFAYSDGTFSAQRNKEKTVVGMVYQKKIIHDGEEWELGILSNTGITDYLGPDYYYYSGGVWSNSDPTYQKAIWNLMSNKQGLGISDATPSAAAYTGMSASALLSVTDINKAPYITFNSREFASHGELVTSGKTSTKNQVNVGITRLQAFIQNNPDFASYISRSPFVDDDGALVDIQSKDWDTIFDAFNSSAKTVVNSTADYYKVLNPLALRISSFTPDNLSGKGSDYYSRGKWYIPSQSELELLVWYRIRSTASSTTLNSEAYWNNTDYISNSADRSNIFTNKYTDFDSFLSNSLISSEISAGNKNVVYGEHTYSVWMGTSTSRATTYGWFGEWYADPSYQPRHQDACRRDLQYTITPCCQVTVTKY